MSDNQQFDFEPILQFNAVGDCELHSGQSAEVEFDGTLLTGDASTWLLLSPNPRLVIDATFPLGSIAKPFSFSSDSLIARFSIDGKDVAGIASAIIPDLMGRELRIKWTAKSAVEALGDKEADVSRVVFHLFNLPDILGGRRSQKTLTQGSWTAIEHVDLMFGDYLVEVRSLAETRENIKHLKTVGGYRLTHVGCVRRSDGSTFSGSAARVLISALRLFLSFAVGGRCEPACPYGLDTNGRPIWAVWTSPSLRFESRFSWFDHHTIGQLQALFPDFMRLWSNPDWQEPLRECIYWYIVANDSSRGIDAGLILVQTGLERLAFEYAVNEKRLLSPQGFNALWASDKLRVLLSSLGIPLEIPPETQALQAEAKAKNWADAPHALTESRNALVHPGRKQKRMTGEPLLEAWKLGMWYLEMSILAVCGYKGTYGNRLRERTIGEVTPVPWV